MPADSASERVTGRQRIVAVAGTALLFLAMLAGCSDDRDGPGGTPPSRTAPAQDPSGPVIDHDDPHESVVPPLAAATDVVRKFAAIWVDTAMPEREWFQALEPLCERGFALRVQRGGKPKGDKLTIRGAPQVLVPPSPAPGKPGPEFGVRAVYQVPVDRGIFTVTVEAVGGTWLVFAADHKRQVTT